MKWKLACSMALLVACGSDERDRADWCKKHVAAEQTQRGDSTVAPESIDVQILGEPLPGLHVMSAYNREVKDGAARTCYVDRTQRWCGSFNESLGRIVKARNLGAKPEGATDTEWKKLIRTMFKGRIHPSEGFTIPGSAPKSLRDQLHPPAVERPKGGGVTVAIVANAEILQIGIVGVNRHRIVVTADNQVETTCHGLWCKQQGAPCCPR